MQKKQSNPQPKSSAKKPSQKRRFPLREVLISLGVSLGLLGAVVGASIWYQAARNVVFEPITMIICDAVGFVFLFAIVYHFVRKPAETEY